MYHFRYPVAGGSGEHLPVATTRPETILGDTAVAVHPEAASLLATRTCLPSPHPRILLVLAVGMTGNGTAGRTSVTAI